ncbi:MAG: BadF/BadG/BcrA/BcrD ATPase family protein, partial [Kiritimatiellia bacterium]|nr:BadF/BadG/BcrA/BcrD ATPase family protein [Kiritimatiellia bacterium]
EGAVSHLTEADELHIGICGIHHRQALGEMRPRSISEIRIGEEEPAFLLARETCGLVALSGTGALVFARSRDGKTLKLDGDGPLLGDRGSGFEIGFRAVRAVAQSGWHPRHATSLAAALYADDRYASEFHDLNGLRRFMQSSWDRSKIAAFVPVVDREARKGDRVAREILRASAESLAETVRDVADLLAVTDEPLALIGVGGVIRRSDIYWEALVRRVAEFSPGFRPVRIPLPMVAGVALRVLKETAGEGYAAARSRLLTELESRMSRNQEMETG